MNCLTRRVQIIYRVQHKFIFNFLKNNKLSKDDKLKNENVKIPNTNTNTNTKSTNDTSNKPYTKIKESKINQYYRDDIKKYDGRLN